MAKFRKKPVVIEAWKLPEKGANPSKSLLEFLHSNNILSDYDEGVSIPTLEGTMRGDPGDWIIKGVKGEVYPCKPDIFEATYERVDDKESTPTDLGYFPFKSDSCDSSPAEDS